MWLWALPAWAGAVLTREPSKAELTPPVVIPNDLDVIKADKAWSDEVDRQRERMILRGLDTAMRWQTPLLGDCGAGETTVKVRFGSDGRVRSVAPVKGADAALAACIAAAYEATSLPVLHVEPSVVWSFRLDGEKVPVPRAIDRDFGFNGVEFGASSASVEGLVFDSDRAGVRYYHRILDGRHSLFGTQAGMVSYGFSDAGLCVVYVAFYGDAAGFTIRQGLNGRYGASKVDASTKGWYWQGERVLATLYQASEEKLVLVLLDIERARAAGILDTLPDEAKERKFEVPRYLRKD